MRYLCRVIIGKGFHSIPTADGSQRRRPDWDDSVLRSDPGYRLVGRQEEKERRGGGHAGWTKHRFVCWDIYTDW